ncbi:hypothetical protein [Anaplasma capra]|uniref:hypothetical protein n=1 Tax=Anaplasma capra TaxID=1562740 RepID=UPI0021D56D42|nr:hypothetical protein [Anaplasma capra]
MSVMRVSRVINIIKGSIMARTGRRVVQRSRQCSNFQEESLPQLQHNEKSGEQQRAVSTNYSIKSVSKLVVATTLLAACIAGSLYIATVMLARRWLYLVIAIDALATMIFGCIVFAIFRRKAPAIPTSALITSFYGKLFESTNADSQAMQNSSSTGACETISGSQQPVRTACASMGEQSTGVQDVKDHSDDSLVRTYALVHRAEESEDLCCLPSSSSLSAQDNTSSTPSSVCTYSPGRARSASLTLQTTTLPEGQFSGALRASTSVDNVAPVTTARPKASMQGDAVEFRPVSQSKLKYSLGVHKTKFSISKKISKTVRQFGRELSEAYIPRRLPKLKGIKHSAFAQIGHIGKVMTQSGAQRGASHNPDDMSRPGTQSPAVNSGIQQKDMLPMGNGAVMRGFEEGKVASDGFLQPDTHPNSGGSGIRAHDTSAAAPKRIVGTEVEGACNDLGAKPTDFSRSGALPGDLREVSVTDEKEQVMAEDSEGRSAEMSDTASVRSLSSEISHHSDAVPLVTKRTTSSLQALKKRVKSVRKVTGHILGGVVLWTEQALGINDTAPSRKYGFQLVSEFCAEGDNLYLFIGENTYRRSQGPSLTQILDTATRSFWLQSGSLYTELGRVPTSNLEYAIFHETPGYSSGHMVVKLNVSGNTIRAVLMHACVCRTLSILQSGRTGKDLMLSVRTNTNGRVGVFKLMSLSSTLQDYRQAFFHAYTENMIQAAVSYISGAVHRKLSVSRREQIAIHDPFGEYAKQDPAGMSGVIDDFLSLNPLGKALLHDVVVSITYIEELIKFSISSGHYPEHHALFWNVMVKQRSCARNAPTDIRTASGRDFVADLHLICALICKKKEITNRKQVRAFIDKIMSTYDEGLDANSTRVAQYLALATVASPKLRRGIKALPVSNGRWKTLLQIIGCTLDLYMQNSRNYHKNMLSVISGEKHPCRVNAVLLSNFIHTTSYQRALSTDRKLSALHDTLGPQYTPHQFANKPQLKRHTRTKRGALRPYAILVANLQRVYMHVEQGRYSRSIVPRLLKSWALLQAKQEVNAESEPSICEALKLLRSSQNSKMHCAQDKVSTLPDTVLASCVVNRTSYPFSGAVLEEIGDAALTGFLSIASVSPACQEFSYLREVCGTNVSIGNAIQ